MSAKDKHYDATMSYIEYIENGQLEEALEKLTKQRDDWKADAERLDNACKLALEIWGSPLYPLTVASIEMAREEHEELKEKK